MRRFVARPIWLGKVSPESGVIAGLIFLLMVTLSRRDSRYPKPLAAGRAIWWTHTLALLVFLPLIPHTKHLHLILSPATIFLKRPGFSDIPKLAGDEDFGLVTGKDVTRIDALQAFSCVECGRCTEHCPAYNTGKVLNPKEVILGLRTYLNTDGPSSEAPLLGEHISEEAVFQCTTCGGCEFQCPVGIQHLPMIIGLRRGAVNTGAWEDSYGTKLFLTMERNGNSLGLALERASEVYREERAADLRRHSGILPVAGLHGRLRSRRPRDHSGAGARCCGISSITFGVLRERKVQRRSGAPARQRSAVHDPGRGEYRDHRQNKVAKLLSICPHCVRTMSVGLGARRAQTVEIEHHSELLERHKARLPGRWRRSAGEGGLSRPLLSRPLPRRLR